MTRRLLVGLMAAAFTLAGCGGIGTGGAGDFGATPGGAQDIALAREKIARGQVPEPEDFVAEGLYSEHDLPLQGPAPALKYYLEQARETAKDSGVRTDIIDCLHGIYDRAIPLIGERDVAAMLEYFECNDTANGAKA